MLPSCRRPSPKSLIDPCTDHVRVAENRNSREETVKSQQWLMIDVGLVARKSCRKEVAGATKYLKKGIVDVAQVELTMDLPLA